MRVAITRIIAAGAMLAVACGAATAAGSSAGYGMGGSFSRFDPVVRQYNQSGELFRIVGRCQSACTLFLAIRNVCVERTATLLFHSGRGRNRQISTTSTSHMLGAYNERLRGYIVANRAMDTFAYHTVSGRDIIEKFGYRECPGK